MTLFKLIFEHDMVLEPVGQPKSPKRESSLEEFLKPVPTYSRFYFSATDLTRQAFGLSASDDFNSLMHAFEKGIGEIKSYLLSDGTVCSTLHEALDRVGDGGAIVLIKGDDIVKPFPAIDPSGSFRDYIPELTNILDKGHLVLFKVKAHHGFDLHVFSRANIYRDFFYAFKPLIRPDLRFFSINGKRAKSERLFYFETWSLHQPPHGFEEVFHDTAFY
ncbi:MAG: hypothetical protein JJU41_12785 [Bacteroidetes bacterium]|nr:hypothetical protein [Bacteroidota bacterium]MCH8525236.1 hypothetical protein [Balneolales bacterium]